jgi:hypothetical protein
MYRLLLALALVVPAAPALPQNVIGENPVLEGGVDCGAFVRMDSVARMSALSAIEPLGGELPGADPTIAAQWAADVATACEGDPERPLDAAARQALGLN